MNPWNVKPQEIPDPHGRGTTLVIAKADLVHGAYYLGHCRNAKIARWDGERQAFVHWRTKFGARFTEQLPHPDDAEPHLDVFIPEAYAFGPDEGIPLEDAP